MWLDLVSNRVRPHIICFLVDLVDLDLKISSERTGKQGIEPATQGLVVSGIIQNTTATPRALDKREYLMIIRDNFS